MEIQYGKEKQYLQYTDSIANNRYMKSILEMACAIADELEVLLSNKSDLSRSVISQVKSDVYSRYFNPKVPVVGSQEVMKEAVDNIILEYWYYHDRY